MLCLLAKMRCGVFAGDFIVQIMITFADFICYVIVNCIGDFFQTITATVCCFSLQANCNDLTSVTFPHLSLLALYYQAN